MYEITYKYRKNRKNNKSHTNEEGPWNVCNYRKSNKDFSC